MSGGKVRAIPELIPIDGGAGGLAPVSETDRGRPLRVAIVGHVDHGKSTLIGRLLHDTGSLPEGKLEALREMSRRRGMPLEWSFVLDAFQAERDQAVTIDTTQIWFKSALRDYNIVDAPGHTEFLKNMISGTAGSDAALLVIAANEGIREQTRRHGYLLSMLGVGQVACLVNKMDLVDHDRERFEAIAAEVAAYLREIGVEPRDIIPIGARAGENIVHRAETMCWYRGRTVMEALDAFSLPHATVDQPLRFAVQDVYRFDERRIIAGRVLSGVLRVGDTLLFSPSGQTARVETIEAWSVPSVPVEAGPGANIGVTLDQPIFVERGDLASHRSTPPMLTNVMRVHMFWLNREPLLPDESVKLWLQGRELTASVQSIERVIDTGDLSGEAGEAVNRNEIAQVVLRTRELMAVDSNSQNPATGRCVMVRGHSIAGGGVISMAGYPDQRRGLTVRATNIHTVEHEVTAEARAARNGHDGGVIWLTGLSGAGKSTLAMGAERLLFHKGYQVYVLDGDNIRHGINADLGFSPEDRAENIRRVGEIASLFAKAGFIVITAFISPFRADRDRARSAVKERFHEVHVMADLATCEKRDPKQLYSKARAGKIKEFTGITSVYEEPDAAELVIDTNEQVESESLNILVRYIERNFMRATQAVPGAEDIIHNC